MTDIVERLRDIDERDCFIPDKLCHEAADEIELLRRSVVIVQRQNAELLAALVGLHDWYVEYAHINNLFNADGTPATFHELLVARAAIEKAKAVTMARL